MPTPASLAGRPADALHLTIVEAMLLDACGPDTGMTIERHGDRTASVSLTMPAIRALQEIATSVEPRAIEGWMQLAAPGLVEAVKDRVGEVWAAEAELGVELLLAVRADDIVFFAGAALLGPVVVDICDEAADLAARGVPDPNLAIFV